MQRQETRELTSNSPTDGYFLGFDQIQAFPRVKPKPYDVGANTAFQILFFIKVYKLKQFKHIVIGHDGDDDNYVL